MNERDSSPVLLLPLRRNCITMGMENGVTWGRRLSFVYITFVYIIFIVPVLFYTITKLAYGKKKLAELEKNYKPDSEHDKES